MRSDVCIIKSNLECGGIKIMRKIFGCCGHDCSRCITYLATIKNDDTLRKQSQQFYKTMFGLDIPLDEVKHFIAILNQPNHG